MDTLSKKARVAGFFYLLVILFAPLRLVYIPGQLFVDGNAAATISNIAAHDMMFRLAIFSDLITASASLVLTFTLYRLFKEVQQSWALLMLMMGFMDTPLYFFNSLTDMGTLILAQAPDYLAAFDQAQRTGLAMLLLKMHNLMTFASEIFWGLWLFPLAALVYRSGFLPRVLALWLTINGVAYLALAGAGLLRPEYNELVAKLAFVCQLGEVAFALWILVLGAKRRQPAMPRAVAA